MNANTKIERRQLAEALYKEYRNFTKKLNTWGAGHVINQCVKHGYVIEYKAVRDTKYGVTYEM